MSDFDVTPFSISEEYMELDMMKIQNQALRTTIQNLVIEKETFENKTVEQAAVIQKLVARVNEMSRQSVSRTCDCPPGPRTIRWTTLFAENKWLLKQVEQLREQVYNGSKLLSEGIKEETKVLVQLVNVLNPNGAEPVQGNPKIVEINLAGVADDSWIENTNEPNTELVKEENENGVGAYVEIDTDIDISTKNDSHIDRDIQDDLDVENKTRDAHYVPDSNFDTNVDTKSNMDQTDLGQKIDINSDIQTDIDEKDDHERDPDYDPDTNDNDSDSDSETESEAVPNVDSGLTVKTLLDKLLTERAPEQVEEGTTKTGKIKQRSKFFCKYPCPHPCKIAEHGVEKFAQLKKHYKTRHMGNVSFYCKPCKSYFINPKSFAYHTKSKHQSS